MDNLTRPKYLTLTKEEQLSALEVLLFSSEEPLNFDDLFNLLVLNENVFNTEDEDQQFDINLEIKKNYDFEKEYFSELIDELNGILAKTGRPYEIKKVAGGYTFVSRREYGKLIQQLVRSRQKKRLSQAALEALAVIAYKQPVTKPEIEQIRGVNSNEVVNSLLEKGFIKIAGKKDVMGKPFMYATTSEFLKLFGLNSLEELPKLRDIEELSIDELNERSVFEIVIDTNDENSAKDLQNKFDNEFNVSIISKDNNDPEGQNIERKNGNSQNHHSDSANKGNINEKPEDFKEIDKEISNN